jgi:hypothetical protein
LQPALPQCLWERKEMPVQPPFEERRHASRFRCDEETALAAVWLPLGEEQIAVVFDESLGGISLMLDDVVHLTVGGEVGIAYAGTFVRGTVRHIRPLAGGKFVVGFSTESFDGAAP